MRTILSVYDVIFPVFVISKLFGLAPFNLHSGVKHRAISAQSKCLALLHTSVIISPLCYCVYLLASAELESNISTTFIMFDASIRILLTAFILASVIFNQNILATTIRHFTLADDLITETGSVISHTSARKYSMCLVTCLTSLYAVQLIIQLLNFEGVLNIMHCILIVADYVDSIFLLQYIGILSLLCQRYNCLNKGVTSLRAQVLLERTKRTFEMYPKEFSTMKQISLLTRNCKKSVKWSLLQVLQSFGNIHNKLYNVGTDVNRVYSPLLLLSVGTSFSIVISQLLTTYEILFHNTPPSPTVSYLLVSVQLFLNAAKIFVISSVSANTANKSKQVMGMMRDIWENETNLQEHITYFSLQILQQNMHFCAGGFFVLDYSVVYSTVGALATYLIILTQFDIV